MNAPLRAVTGTALATSTDTPDYLPAPASPGNTALILNPEHMRHMMAVAEIMAKGIATVPDHLRKSTGDCLAVVMQAAQWGMNPFAVAQKTHVVSGRLGYEAQLVSAVLNSSNLLQRRLELEYFGPWEKIVGKFKELESRNKTDDAGRPKKFKVPAWNAADENGLGVVCKGWLRGESEPRTIELQMTQALTRNSTLWAEDPKQQLAYLAQKRWARLYASDVLLGVYTPDELEHFNAPTDMGRAEVVVPEGIRAAVEKYLADGAAMAAKGASSFGPWWKALGDEARKWIIANHGDRHDANKAAAHAADKARTVDNAAGMQATRTNTVTPPADGDATEDEPLTLDRWRINMLERSDSAVALEVAAEWITALPEADQAQARQLLAQQAAKVGA